MQQSTASILDEEYDQPNKVSEQKAYSVSLPEMISCSSSDEFNIMILNALDAICLHLNHSDDEHEEPASEQAVPCTGALEINSADMSSHKRPQKKIWMQIFADTCTVNSKDVEVTEKKAGEAEAINAP